MINLIEFSVGQQYENRKGVYEVLEVGGDTMRIRWEDGEEADTTVTTQSHIIRRMQHELDRTASNEINTTPKKVEMAKGWQHRIIR